MNNSVILIRSQYLGEGDPTLGETLLENFFTLLKQNAVKPKAIFFINSGVLALTNRSLASLHIHEIAEQGVEILACKTCVNFYQIENEMTSGEISTMKHFLELASQYQVITL